MNRGFTKLFWQAVLTGSITGILVVFFRLGIENLFSFIITKTYSFPVLFLIITTLGGLISGFLVYKFAPETSGSGIPYVKNVLLRSGKLIRVRTVFVKFFAGIIGIGTGLSLGREGPSVQLGAGAGSFIGKLFKLNGNNRDKLIASGAGAAIGATFNAPVAGTLFVLEELIHKFTPAMLFPTLIATVTSASIARYFLGTNPAFDISLPKIDVNIEVIIVCIILGFLTGGLGVLFAKTIFFFDNLYSKLQIPNYTKPALAGFLTGCAGLAVPYILSSGNNSVGMLINNEFSIITVLVIFVLKFVITPLSNIKYPILFLFTINPSLFTDDICIGIFSFCSASLSISIYALSELSVGTKETLYKRSFLLIQNTLIFFALTVIKDFSLSSP